MNDERYQKGLEVMKQYMGNHAAKADEMVKQLDAGLADQLVYQFGEIYGRGGISPEKRVIVTLTSLISLGSLDNLRLHVHSAIHVGLTPEEITEVVIHCMSYIGIPKTIDALKIVKEELEKIEQQQGNRM